MESTVQKHLTRSTYIKIGVLILQGKGEGNFPRLFAQVKFYTFPGRYHRILIASR